MRLCTSPCNKAKSPGAISLKPRSAWIHYQLAGFGRVYRRLMRPSSASRKKPPPPGRFLIWRRAIRSMTTANPSSWNQKDGFVKLLANPKTGEIHRRPCVGPLGGELIHEIVAAMAKRMTVSRTGRDAPLSSDPLGNLDLPGGGTGGADQACVNVSTDRDVFSSFVPQTADDGGGGAEITSRLQKTRDPRDLISNSDERQTGHIINRTSHNLTAYQLPD